VLVADGEMVGTLLLETTLYGRFAKLELATASGLLTLHPERDVLHGNIATPGGMTHVALPWSADAVLIVLGTPSTAAVAARSLEDRIGVGEGHTVAGVSVDVELDVRPATFRVVRAAERRWRFLPAHGGVETFVTMDEDGLPVLAEAEAWPLELPADA
jgi:hypothetical protein